jgi:hypothetical protein
MPSVTCPKCGTVLANRDLPAGKTAACLKCGARFKLPPALATADEVEMAPVTIRTTVPVDVPKRRRSLSWVAAAVLENLAEDAKWAIPLLIDLADVAVQDGTYESYGVYGRGQILEKTIEAMLAIDPRDNRVYQSIKRMGAHLKANSGERDNLTSLRIQIDSAVKEMDRIRREQEEE